MKTKRRWAIWVLRVVLILAILTIATAVIRMAVEEYRAAQLTVQGIPDLRDPTRIEKWLVMMLCSLVEMGSIAGLMRLDPED